MSRGGTFITEKRLPRIFRNAFDIQHGLAGTVAGNVERVFQEPGAGLQRISVRQRQGDILLEQLFRGIAFVVQEKAYFHKFSAHESQAGRFYVAILVVASVNDLLAERNGTAQQDRPGVPVERIGLKELLVGCAERETLKRDRHRLNPVRE